MKKSSVIILTLGTPVDENMNPVFDQINESLAAMLPNLRKYQLIILRSTVSPRTTIYVKDWIEKKSQFKIGHDLYLAFCPERIAEGNTLTEMKEIAEFLAL